MKIRYILSGLVVGLLLCISLVIPQALKRVREAKALGTTYNLKNAISSYFTEYRKLPVPSKNYRPGFPVDSDPELMTILMPNSESLIYPSGHSPRVINFYANKPARAMGSGRFHSGLSPDKTLWDPWGNLYRVQFETDGIEGIEDPSSPGHIVPETILVWSAGPDGDFATWEDNPKSW